MHSFVSRFTRIHRDPVLRAIGIGALKCGEHAGPAQSCAYSLPGSLRALDGYAVKRGAVQIQSVAHELRL